MANSVNWLFDAFLLLFNLHVAFLLFFYFWNVGLSFSCYALFPCFILLILRAVHTCLPFAHFPPSAHFPAGCTSVARSLDFLLPLRTFHILRIFPQNFIKTAKNAFKTACPTCPQHSLVAHPEPLRLFPSLPC
jgi:hypothetical protein